LDVSHIFYKIIVLTFPAIITLALLIIYELDTLVWGRELITLEPNQLMFDAIGEKRFYLKRNKKYVNPRVKKYRTEDDLKGELKKVYQDILRERKG